MQVRAQVGLLVNYQNEHLDLRFRLDLLVNENIVIEVKSVETLHDVHKKQLLTYLKLSGKKVGILVNFNIALLEDKISLIRYVN